jgi:hypothetical protein
MKINQEKLITGNVAILKFYISTNGQEEDNLFEKTLQNQDKLKIEIKENIKEILGSQFELVKFEIRKGSIEIILIIGTIYVVISRYKNFVDSLRLLKNQLDILFNRFYGRHRVYSNIHIESSLTLGEGVTDAKSVVDYSMYNYVVIYLILTNFILIGTIVYIVLK